MFDPKSITRYDILRVGWRLAGLLVLVVASATGSYVAMAAVVSLQPPDNNTLLRIPVLLEGEGEEVMAGVQFDLQFDPTRYTLEGVEAGTITTEAGKETIQSEPTPGTGRVLITGFNNQALADGHVATLILRRRAPDATEDSLAIGNFMASDPFGNQVALDYRDDYHYPPVAPEPIEARLVETSGDGESTPLADEEVSSDPFTDSAAETDNNSDILSAPYSAVASGQVGESNVLGDDPVRPPSTDHTQHRTGPRNTGTPANISTAAPHTPPRTPRIASQHRSTGGATDRSGVPSQGLRRSAIAKRSTPRESINTDTKPPTSSQANSPTPRLALALPDYPTASALAPPHSGPDPSPSAGALAVAPQNKTAMALSVGLFLIFFLGFGVLHIKVVRFLSRSTRRKSS